MDRGEGRRGKDREEDIGYVGRSRREIGDGDAGGRDRGGGEHQHTCAIH